MKKTLTYLAVLILLAGITWWMVAEDRSGTLDQDEQQFAIDDTAAIGKIFMADMGELEITLERTGGFWMVNQKYKVREDGIDLLLRTLKNIRVDYPVTKAAHDNVVKLLATDATKVEVYDRENRLLKAYYVGGPTPDNKGTNMILENAKRAYVIHIPGFQGYAGSRYFLDETAWRDRTVFRYKPHQIKKVRLEYTLKPQHSFELLVVQKDSVRVRPLNDSLSFEGQSVDQLFAKRYLTYFNRLNAEGYENTYGKKDSVLATQPFLRVAVTNHDGLTKKANVFFKPVTERTKYQFDERGNRVKFDEDRYFALINENKDFVMIQHFNFGKIMVPIERFFLKAS